MMFEHFHYMSNAFGIIKATEGEAIALCPHCPLCIYVNSTKWLKHVARSSCRLKKITILPWRAWTAKKLRNVRNMKAGLRSRKLQRMKTATFVNVPLVCRVSSKRVSIEV